MKQLQIIQKGVQHLFSVGHFIQNYLFTLEY